MTDPIVLAAVGPAASVALSEIGAMLLALGIFAYIAVRLKISVVPIYLALGLALGNGGLVPLDFSEEFLTTGAQIGAILLLLMLGLEHSGPNLVAGFLERKSTGIIDFAVNAIPGAIVALLMGWGIVGAIILGGITYVSSSGIAAQMMKESGWNRSEVSRRVITVLVVEDLALAPYLPLVSTILAGLGALAGVISVGVALAITSLAILISFKGKNAFARILNTNSQGALLLTVFGAALVAAGLSEMVGFSSAVAAFLVGLILTGEVAEAVRLRLSPLRDLFAAIFFCLLRTRGKPCRHPRRAPDCGASRNSRYRGQDVCRLDCRSQHVRPASLAACRRIPRLARRILDPHRGTRREHVLRPLPSGTDDVVRVHHIPRRFCHSASRSQPARTRLNHPHWCCVAPYWRGRAQVSLPTWLVRRAPKRAIREAQAEHARCLAFPRPRQQPAPDCSSASGWRSRTASAQHSASS